ncbi:MAG: hypothetical protein SVZ03_14055 [Spirochaetota bacterium]|nr:hypothetical protein [Spirochaetota bacterium]
MIKCHDLENEEIYNKYRAIFFPCGMYKPIETNVNILSRGTKVQAVLLKNDISEVNREKICNNIKSFIHDGGVGYFSGYSYEFLQGSLKPFEFFDDFPNMGMAGRVTLELKDELYCFCRNEKLALYMFHQGWIAVKSVKEAEVVAEGSFETPKGIKFGPIISILKRGEGEALYTSYHNKGYNRELLRYMIYRISYRHILSNLIDIADKWEQDVSSSIVDSVRGWESSRTYRIYLSRGKNTIYFDSRAGLFQVDLFDMDDRLIISLDPSEGEFYLNIDAELEGYHILKVYPSTKIESGAYGILSARGSRFLPYYQKGLLALLVCVVIFIIYRIEKMVAPRKFHGRIRQK